MMNIRMMVTDQEIVKDLLITKLDKKKGVIELSKDCIIRPKHKYIPSRGVIENPEFISFVVEKLTEFGWAIFAAWIIDLIKTGRVNIEIDGRNVPTSEEGIKKFLDSLHP